jgi:hypothetical protein
MEEKFTIVPERRAHARQGRADDVGQTEDVDVEDAADLVVGALLHGGEVPDAGVVDQHVDAAEVLLRGLDGLLDLRGVSHVEGQRERLLVAFDEILDLSDVAGGDDRLVAGGEDLPGQGAAEAGRAAGDEPDLLRSSHDANLPQNGRTPPTANTTGDDDGVLCTG